MLQCLGDMNVVIEIFVDCDIPVTIGMVKLVYAWYYRRGKCSIPDWSKWKKEIITIKLKYAW